MSGYHTGARVVEVEKWTPRREERIRRGTITHVYTGRRGAKCCEIDWDGEDGYPVLEDGRKWMVYDSPRYCQGMLRVLLENELMDASGIYISENGTFVASGPEAAAMGICRIK